MDEEPGPPLSQIASGAVEGFLRASKNQKNLAIPCQTTQLMNQSSESSAAYVLTG